MLKAYSLPLEPPEHGWRDLKAAKTEESRVRAGVMETVECVLFQVSCCSSFCVCFKEKSALELF